MEFKIVLKNNGSESGNVTFMSENQATSQSGSTYTFTLPYRATYNNGEFFRINVGSIDHYVRLTQETTRESLIALLNALSFGDWSLDSSTANNIYNCFSANTVNYLEIDYYKIDAPVSSAATSVTNNSFSANWSAVALANSYYLDVATDSAFNNMITGYNNLNVGNVTTYSVIGLSSGTNYYYRVRSYYTAQQVNSSNSSTINLTTSASTITYYAGTSPDALILSSTNGETWSNLGSAEKGNPLAFCKLSNGDLLYTTDEGWVVNHTQSTSVKVSDYAITAIAQSLLNHQWMLVGDSNGDTYGSGDYGETFYTTEWISIGAVNAILGHPTQDDFFCFTSSGIYFTDVLIQAGNFTSAYYDSTNGFIYVGASNGHIWKNTTASDFNAWTDLGNKTSDGTAIIKITPHGSALDYITANRYYTTIDNWSTQWDYWWDVDANDIVCGTGNTDVYIAGSDGHIYTMDEEGLKQDLGQQFSQTSINCLIAIE